MTEDLRAKTCCFTGHRRIPEEALPRLERRLNEELEALAARGVIYFGAGGALGFDTLAAEAVIRLQRTRPQVKLILGAPQSRPNPRLVLRQCPAVRGYPGAGQ